MKSIKRVAAVGAVVLAAGCASANSGSDMRGMNQESGADLWRATCSHCHNLRGAQEFTAEQWPIIVSHMRTRAKISKSDAELIQEYLVRLTERS